MSASKLPPFYIGQKVICVKDGKNGKGIGVTKGEVYQIKNIVACNCQWSVDVGISGGSLYGNVCPRCGKAITPPTYSCYASASLFGPIREDFQSITLESIMQVETPLISSN